jgi:hypothetical protein
MKLITYSLYVSNRNNVDFYYQGLMRNLDLAKQLYPDYKVRVYLQESLQEYKSHLEKNGAEIVIKTYIENNQIPTLWRFEPLIDENFEIVLFRDADSLLYRRERDLVRLFEASKYNFHIIRDHPDHIMKILAGMWGAKKTNQIIKNIIKRCYDLDGKYSFEEKYFQEHLYEHIKDESLIHDSNITPSVFNIYPNEGRIGLPYQ